MAEPGAQAALRGYRLQSLYTLYRLLQPADNAKSFRLEGHEDLDILDGEGHILEVIQLKAYATALSLSHLKPQKADSFFRRVLRRRASFPEARESIVSFGPYGAEMQAAWAGDPAHRAHALELFESWDYTPAQAQELLATVRLDTANETELEAAIFAILKETVTGCDPVSAFDVLHAWLFQAAEERATITRSELQERLLAVGRFLKERDAHQAEWFTAVRPLEDISVLPKNELDKEFYQGVSTRYEHILAGVDIVRPGLLAMLKAAFDSSRVVVVRGASGQGKSTLAYRFLHDHVPAASRFEVRLVQDRRHALNIARALLGHLSNIGAVSYIYIDVTPGDTAWTDLVQSLSGHPSARILVTIREEDWLRASISGADLLFEEVKLQFEENEARSIYSLLLERTPRSKHLDFEEVWERFGGGPLLEFTYLVTHHDTLKGRLGQQVRRLSDEVQRGVRPRAEMELLRRVAVASAYGARLDLVLLARDLELSEPLLSVQRLEREYLIRPDSAGRLVEGLHPVRSEILVGLLTDPVFTPWAEVATRSLSQMVECDLGEFLLNAFSRHSNASDTLQQALSSLKPLSWEGVAQVCRALVWWGLSDYVTHDAAVLAEAKKHYGKAWWVALKVDVGNVRGAAPGLMTNPLEELNIISEERKQAWRELQARQSDPTEIFAAASRWLRNVTWQLKAPASAEGWIDTAEVVFRAAWYKLPLPGLGELLEAYASALNELPLETAVDVAYACSFHVDAQVSDRLESLRPRLLERIRRELRIVRLDDDGQRIKAHFVIIPREFGLSTAPELNDQNLFHAIAIRCANLLRGVFPVRSVYATQGYGHRFSMLPVDFDETVKNIEAGYLPPEWAARINNMFLNLASYSDRPATWEAHAREVLAIRQELVRLLQMIRVALEEYFQGRDAKPLVRAGRPDWEDYEGSRRRIALRTQLLPQAAVDEWGFSSEGNDQAAPTVSYGRDHQVALLRHKPYVSLLRDYERSLSNFLKQALDALLLQPLLIRGNAAQTEVARTVLQKRDRQKLDTNLPMSNLSDALAKLPALRREFRARLARFLDEGELAVLETREEETLHAVRALWLMFTTAPARGDVRQPLRLAQSRVEKALELIRGDLLVGFKALAEQQATARILAVGASWNQGPALWLVLDMDSPLTLHPAREALLRILHSALARDKIGLPLLHVVRTTWQHIVIIPTFRGRAIASSAWAFSALTLICNRPEELGWWNQALHPVPEETWDGLGIERWTHSRISWAEDFQAALGQFGLMLDEFAHVVDSLADVEVDTLGREVLTEFARVEQERMREVVERVVETLTRMFRFLTALGPDALAARPFLTAVVPDLRSISEVFQGIDIVGPEELQRLRDGYKNILSSGEVVRLYWLADALEHGA
ncbi:hypothetical protein HPC49_35590 [Pyxidicoccus fallax]|uniref:Uncharacterized protein n=1 Tax=Pyxidicoccus fallax TaxID=394095 RepID=A0A848LXR5_9BACT|nr:hypothetical protein [Pyxidicoccus fallax]NMO22034.1 hypothetical protein [Pyxidicoccus fallax]NPC83535.1 hypothetical protein [Pyxidicoccus fallax]